MLMGYIYLLAPLPFGLIIADLLVVIKRSRRHGKSPSTYFVGWALFVVLYSCAIVMVARTHGRWLAEVGILGASIAFFSLRADLRINRDLARPPD